MRSRFIGDPLWQHVLRAKGRMNAARARSERADEPEPDEQPAATARGQTQIAPSRRTASRVISITAPMMATARKTSPAIGIALADSMS